MRINLIRLGDLDQAGRNRLLARASAGFEEIEPVVQEIINDVRQRGDDALVEYTHRFDGALLSPATMRVSGAEFAQAEHDVSEELRIAIQTAVENIRHHHRHQLPVEGWMTSTPAGAISGERITPIESVGIYVPRGKGSFPSVLMMLCVPAMIAAVPAIVVCTPPGPDGRVDAASLVAARICGVENVVKVGGAQAIAALAFGTGQVPRVCKILGPGNPYVTVAKRLVYGHVDPGPPTGPSESIVLCDADADPQTAAVELLVEAEHGPDSAALLVTPSAQLAAKARDIAETLVTRLPAPRRGYCENVLSSYGGIVLTEDLKQALDFVNEYAPEHLRIMTGDPLSLLYQITNAGEVLLGNNTAIPFGNFAIGTNAILPTGGSARSYSCIGVSDFMKRSSFAYVPDRAVAAIGAVSLALARYEGFPAHANAIEHVMNQAHASP
jgi:histidinol dehydrogenase